MSIRENLINVEERITKACERAGRDRSEVTLIAVSKTKPVYDLEEAMRCGITIFGENKVQEIRDKSEAIKEPVSFHMIGHLQTNKVKYLPGKVVMIHSVDKISLAEEIEKQFAKTDSVIDVLCEVNMAGEDTKFGLAPDEVFSFVREIAKLPHLRVRGLMTIAPFTEDPESNRQYFRALREMKDKLALENISGTKIDTLSMGMTGDYEVAIEEGATFVRVGTGIFGAR